MDNILTSNSIFIARQPIFDQHQRVWAYELLFRKPLANAIKSVHKDDEYSTMKVIANAIINFGLQTLTGGKRAFINFGHELLTKGIPYILPKNLLGIEILETIEPDSAVLKASAKLKADGYLLILDDFIFLKKFIPLLKMADIVKIEVTSDMFKKNHLLKALSENTGIQFLAEKIESHEQFNTARDLGYSYFQGFFFCKPELIAVKDIPGTKIHYLRLLRELNQSKIRIDQVENIMKREVSLTYKLFRFINSVHFGFKNTIGSVRHALNLLGEREIKKWLSFLVLSGMGVNKPSELIQTAVIRARFSELVSEAIDKKNILESDLHPSNFFLMGMFSLIDSMLGRPMDEILKELPIHDDIKAALQGKNGVYKRVLDIVCSYEQAQWDRFSENAKAINCQEAVLANLYFKAVSWSKQVSPSN